jgi:2-keto-4-pentenoate hydratase/2-oxohepta-3-ene-1,7-dioic acid hydratase in catechol pathway
LGLVVGSEVRDVTSALAVLPPPRYPAPAGDTLVMHLDLVRSAIERLRDDGARIPLAQVELLSPVANPSKIIGVPVNFATHVQEAKNAASTFKQYDGGIEDQGLFLKATSSLVGCSRGVQVRFPQRQTHHEIELGVIIGKVGANIPLEQALSYVAGYAVALDMTVRGSEDRSFRKSLDTYSVLGPWLTTADEVPDPQQLDFGLSVNGQTRQKSNTRHMIMGIAQQIAWASTFYTLLPGDVIMSGTCEGVGAVQPGDVMQCEIESVGSMTVSVH